MSRDRDPLGERFMSPRELADYQRQQQSAELRTAIHNAQVRAELHYTWATPHDWLAEKLMHSEDVLLLRGYALSLLGCLDSDQVQDIFQTEMSRDGYFEPRREER